MTHCSRRVTRSSRAAQLFIGSTLLLGASLALAGCSATNPSQIATPYPAADGTNAEISDPTSGSVVKLRNFLLVGTEKGKPAQLVGAIANDGTAPVQVQLSIDAPTPGAPTPDASAAPSATPPLALGVVTAVPGQLTLIGPGGTAVNVASLPIGPGATIVLKARTGAGGELLTIPVVPATGQYASLPPGSPAAG